MTPFSHRVTAIASPVRGGASAPASDDSGSPAPVGESAASVACWARLGLALAPLAVAVSLLWAAASPAHADSCPNGQFRTGYAASLPDCRAYELVTPRNTNGQAPTDAFSCSPFFLGVSQDAPLFAPVDQSYMYCVPNTALAGLPGNGAGNEYRATRTADGWVTTAAGPDANQLRRYAADSLTEDHSYQVFTVGSGVGGQGSLDVANQAAWLRHPDGSYTPLEQGSIPSSPDTDGYNDGLVDDFHNGAVYLSPHGEHILFESSEQLTTDAPSGHHSLYDRTSAGLSLVSVLPDGTPVADADFAGVSRDGSVVAFTDGLSDLWVRASGETVELSTKLTQPGGVSDDGRYVFWSESGNLVVYDRTTQSKQQINSSGDATFVNVSADGSHVYFASSSQLDGSKGVAGQPNLYVWDGGQIRFIATVTADDMRHVYSTITEHGLGEWSGDPQFFTPALRWSSLHETSRTTPDGTVFVFESSAQLTDYENAGFREIYRYDAATGALGCVSCRPSGVPPDADSRLSAGKIEPGQFLGLNESVLIQNVTPDGRTVFFESDDSLLPADANHTSDIYEWHDGTLSLVSSGQASSPTFLTGMSPDGHDVFFTTSAALVPNSQEPGVPAIYDARVDGGLAPQWTQAQPGCAGDACQSSGSSSGAPPPAAIGSVSFSGPSTAAAVQAARVRIARHAVSGTRFSLTVQVPAAGEIKAAGRRIATVHKRAGKAGSYKLTLKLTKSSLRTLRRARRMTVRVKITFTPSVGNASTAAVSFSAKAPRAKTPRAGKTNVEVRR